MFDEELITWSVDGGGRLFHRKKHKFSVTNVGGILRILNKSNISYPYLHMLLELRHSQVRFDWIRKAHPSVIKDLYVNLPIPSMDVQHEVVRRVNEIRQQGDVLARVYAHKIQKLNLLKASLLNQAFASRAEAA
jgi:type I restriction enzyme S subunit